MQTSPRMSTNHMQAAQMSTNHMAAPQNMYYPTHGPEMSHQGLDMRTQPQPIFVPPRGMAPQNVFQTPYLFPTVSSNKKALIFNITRNIHSRIICLRVVGVLAIIVVMSVFYLLF